MFEMHRLRRETNKSNKEKKDNINKNVIISKKCVWCFQEEKRKHSCLWKKERIEKSTLINMKMELEKRDKLIVELSRQLCFKTAKMAVNDRQALTAFQALTPIIKKVDPIPLS